MTKDNGIDEAVDDICDDQGYEEDPAKPFEEGDRIEWRAKGKACSGTVLGTEEDALIVAADVPTGEPCPIFWGPFDIFSKVSE